MERKQYDWQHDYLATPWEYPISANENHSTYDQFIQLRDTLIFTWKYYNDKASRKLCVGDKGDWTTTNTIEVWLPNYFVQRFEPDWATNPASITPEVPNIWNYVTPIPTSVSSEIDQSLLAEIWPLCCYINKAWHYRLIHKEEVKLETSQNKACCYIDVYRKNDQWIYEIKYKWWVAVFDWEWGREDNSTHFKKAFSWTTSWTDPNGSCSVTVTLTLWDIIQKMTAFWYMERDLMTWDILALRMKDKWAEDGTWKPQWNNLTLQQWSNYWSIEYLDLPYNI